jgi:hypothetical protein
MSLTNQQGSSTPQNADELLDLIRRVLPQLWSAQQRSGSRALRTTLNAAERLLAASAAAEPPHSRGAPHTGGA